MFIVPETTNEDLWKLLVRFAKLHSALVLAFPNIMKTKTPKKSGVPSLMYISLFSTFQDRRIEFLDSDFSIFILKILWNSWNSWSSWENFEWYKIENYWKSLKNLVIFLYYIQSWNNLFPQKNKPRFVII